jgi:hypothetical protein
MHLGSKLGFERLLWFKASDQSSVYVGKGQTEGIVYRRVSCDLANLWKKDLAVDDFTLCEKNNIKINLFPAPLVGIMNS